MILNTLYTNFNKKDFIDNQTKLHNAFWIICLSYIAISEINDNNTLYRNYLSGQLPILIPETIKSDDFIEPVIIFKSLYLKNIITFEAYRQFISYIEDSRKLKKFNGKKFKELLYLFNYRTLIPDSTIYKHVYDFIDGKTECKNILYYLLILNNQLGLSKNITQITDSMRSDIIKIKR